MSASFDPGGITASAHHLVGGRAETAWVDTHGRRPGFGHPRVGFNGSGFGKAMGRPGVDGFLRRETIWHAHG